MGKAGDGVMFWGVDGGGTSTRGILQTGPDTYGELVAASASNILVVGQDAAFAAMDAVLEKLGQSFSLPEYPGVMGLAGCDRTYVREAWREYCVERGLRRVWITGDYWLPWSNFTHGKDGLIAIFGTGSVVFGQSHNHPIRLGGYGWKLGDPGSGLSVGRQGVKMAIRSAEGLEESTALTEKSLAFFGVQSIDDIIEQIYAPAYPVRQLADFAPAVFDAAEVGDGVAAKLLLREGQAIREMMNGALHKLGLSDPSVGLSGGMSRLWYAYWHRPGAQKCGIHFTLVTGEAVYGALRLAKNWSQERRLYDTGEYFSQ
jgi:N-acetylglucosamine kinase-like BadF-type ATPase